MPEDTRRDGSKNSEATCDDVNLLAMQMQLNQFQPVVSVRELWAICVSVRIDCCTPNSALEIALSDPTKTHAKIVLLLQRQLVIERRNLLEDVIKQKQQEEINLIKKHRRQMNRLRRQAGTTSTVDQEVSQAVETAPAQRSPFALPIVPSLKQKKPKSDTSDRRPTEDSAFSSSALPIAKGKSSVSQNLNRSSSLRGLLEVQLLALPATRWRKVGSGEWRQVEVRPRKTGSKSALNDGDSFTPASHDMSQKQIQKQIQAAVQEVVAKEGKWQAFIAEANTRPKAVCGHEAAWELENLDS